jgi:hypothetical protein
MKTALLSKKNLLKVLLIGLGLTLSNCSKSSDSPAQPTQNPLAGYLAASGFDQKTTNQINVDDYEFGYSFIPMVNGKMTAIVVKIPDSRAGMRITVWDKVAGTVLRTETIDIPTAGVEASKDITPLDLTSGKEYFLTFNSNDWYDRRRTDGSNVTYPFTVGDIKITSYSFISGAAQNMPNSSQLSYYGGDCSFKFQK